MSNGKWRMPKSLAFGIGHMSFSEVTRVGNQDITPPSLRIGEAGLSAGRLDRDARDNCQRQPDMSLCISPMVSARVLQPTQPRGFHSCLSFHRT
jgi:hypothetical protein